jgi:hypothetical protein
MSCLFEFFSAIVCFILGLFTVVISLVNLLFLLAMFCLVAGFVWFVIQLALMMV